VTWGYWAVLIGLAAESAGLPFPGETTLMFASFLSHKNTGLQLQWVILVGIIAASAGDNLGFWFGRHFGDTFLKWARTVLRADNRDISAARELLKRHGSLTVFLARFVFGLRTIAGPMAGTLGMRWTKFLIFNVLGAAVWVTAMSLAGFAFASQFNTLLDYFEKASWALAGVLFLTGYIVWRKYKNKFSKEH
jgi:membrane-associated protein